MVLLPTTVVGSYSVPEWLERLKTEYYQRRISARHLAEIHDVAIKAAVKDQELAGIDIVSDGELRRDNDVDYFLARIPGVHIPQRAKTDYFDYYDAEVVRPLPEGPVSSAETSAETSAGSSAGPGLGYIPIEKLADLDADIRDDAGHMRGADLGFGDLRNDRVLQAHYVAQQPYRRGHEQEPVVFQIRTEQSKAEQQHGFQHQRQRVFALCPPAPAPVDHDRGGGSAGRECGE